MKKIYILITFVLMAALSSCHKPEYVAPTADRQGLTSLTAIFTFGPYVDQELAKLVINDDTKDRYEIPVPLYFPVTSDDKTDAYMYKVRVKAELQPNFTISPGLGVIDLTEENWYDYTDPFGNVRKICITGKQVKSSACEIASFVITSPQTITGVIDKEKKIITLPTKDDVSACKAKVQISAHAKIAPDPTKEHDYTDGFKYIVTADDGTVAEYLVQTGEPQKIPMGFDVSTIEQLFNFDPVTRLGMPPYNVFTAVSLAAIEGNLIICKGDGSAPFAINGLDGSKIGDIKLGDAVAGSITNDEAGNLLITSVAQGGEMFKIYKTNSIKKEPEFLCSITNPVDCPVGHKMKAMGDVNDKAVITLTAEGIDGVTSSAKAVYLLVEEGNVMDFKVVDFASLGVGWASAPVNTATVVPASLDPDKDGWFFDYYGENCDADGNYLLHYVTPSMKDNIVAGIGDWANNPNCLDSKSFNNARYMALFVVSHFPCWGRGPMLYVFNITDPSSASLVVENDLIQWFQAGDYSCASGDVVLSPSSDGYKLYIYYYDHNSQAVGGYVADCIKRE